MREHRHAMLSMLDAVHCGKSNEIGTSEMGFEWRCCREDESSSRDVLDDWRW